MLEMLRIFDSFSGEGEKVTFQVLDISPELKKSDLNGFRFAEEGTMGPRGKSGGSGQDRRKDKWQKEFSNILSIFIMVPKSFSQLKLHIYDVFFRKNNTFPFGQIIIF